MVSCFAEKCHQPNFLSSQGLSTHQHRKFAGPRRAPPSLHPLQRPPEQPVGGVARRRRLSVGLPRHRRTVQPLDVQVRAEGRRQSRRAGKLWRQEAAEIEESSFGGKQSLKQKPGCLN